MQCIFMHFMHAFNVILVRQDDNCNDNNTDIALIIILNVHITTVMIKEYSNIIVRITYIIFFSSC